MACLPGGPSRSCIRIEGPSPDDRLDDVIRADGITVLSAYVIYSIRTAQWWRVYAGHCLMLTNTVLVLRGRFAALVSIDNGMV